jgi:catechol 2,3-dioxygenase-like lactoylglutathione lyase family enzyme
MTSFAYVEHANITVKNLDRTVAFIRAALPDWSVRGEGALQWYGKPVRWLHIGTEATYLALQDGGEGVALDWTGHQVGTKHIGIVVPSVDALVTRLAAAGHALDHAGGDHPHRKRAYFMDPDGLQFEFVEYLSDRPAERNDYSR